MTIDIDEIERLAKAATRGEWKAERHLDWVYPQTEVRATEIDRPVARFVNGEPTFCCTIGKAEREWANADYIAAVNPAAILALIAEVRALREDAERYRWLRVQPCSIGRNKMLIEKSGTCLDDVIDAAMRDRRSD